MKRRKSLVHKLVKGLQRKAGIMPQQFRSNLITSGLTIAVYKRHTGYRERHVNMEHECRKQVNG
jgi:hypothetical protein